MPRIAALLIYPVEWGRPVRVKGASVSALGIEGDRRFRITDDQGAVHRGPELSQLFFERRGAELAVSAAGCPRLALPSQQADAWFSKLLGRPAHCVPCHRGEGAALLATTVASLARLNQELAGVVGIERFAPSLVLEGSNPFEEDGWRAVRVGGARFTVVPAVAPRLPFGVELRLEGAATVQLRPGQTVEVERG